MRRWLALLAIAIAWWPTLARAEDRIRMWHAWRGDEEAALLELLAQWDGTPVEVLAVPYDALSSKVSSAIPFGEGPHVFIDSHERLGDYRRRGLVVPVGDAYEAGAFVEQAAAAVALDGEPHAIPLSLKSLALFVNDDLVRDAPAQLESVIELQRTLPAGTFALAYEANNAYAHAAILHACGGRLLSDDDRFGMVGPEAEASFAIVQSLLDAGAVPSEADGALVTNLFRSGRAALAISGPWLAADLGDAVRYHVEPLPALARTGAPLQPLLTVESAMLSPDGAADPEVRAFVRWLASARAAKLRADRARAVTARADVPTDDPIVRAFAEQARTAIPMSTRTAMRAAWEPANKAMRKILRGDASITDALAEAEHRFALVMRPPPAPRSPVPLFVVLGGLTLVGAFVLVRRSRATPLRTELRRSLPAWLWVIHAVIAVGALVVLPLVVGAATSLFAGPPGDVHYVGAANFVDILSARGGPLFASGSFWLTLVVTVAWTVVNVALHVGLGLVFGLLLARPVLRMRAMYRVLLIIPWAVPNYVTALAWKGMFHRQFGAVTGATMWLSDVLGVDIEPISWFSRFSTAFTANVATNAWLGFPFMMVVTVAALGSVPKDVLEAAEIDGATKWQRFRHVTLPMIGPSLVPAVVLGAIWTFNMFNVVFLVSGGDPDGTTDILVSEAYRWAFTRDAQYGYAAAYAVLIFVLLSGITRGLDRVAARARARGGG
jgi:arabinogalactan oligomer/maltooligosaccharide transport system permease protein